MASKPKHGPIYGWLYRHAWLITLCIALAGVMVAAAGLAPRGPPLPDPVSRKTEDVPHSTAPVDVAAQAKVHRLERAEKLFKITLERHPDLRSFLFADYIPSAEVSQKGTVYIYSATRSDFVEIDSETCSYPDQTIVQTDFDQRYLLMACGFPYFLDKEMLGDQVYSNSVVTIRLFDSDQKVSDIIACWCEGVTLKNPKFDVKARRLELTVISTGDFVGGPNTTIQLQPGDDGVRTRTQYDAAWEAVSFKRVRDAAR